MLQAGQVLNDTYEIKEELGHGGGGTVYKAWHLRMKIFVAIKLVNDGLPDSFDVRSEVDILKSLKHPNLPIVMDYVEKDGQIYTVMEYISGSDLKSFIEDRKCFSEAEICDYMIQLCDAVEYLHSHKPPIIHSDIKPANIMLNDEGTICLIDFNISRITDKGKAVSQGGSRVYAAPEQFRQVIDAPNDLDEFHEETRFMTASEVNKTAILQSKVSNPVAYVDIRTDIYGIGVTIFYLMTGRAPKNGSVDVSHYAFSPAMKRLIATATNPDPKKRYENATQLKAELMKVRKGADTTPGLVRRTDNFRMPVKLVLIPAAISVICVAGAVIVLLSDKGETAIVNETRNTETVTETVTSKIEDEESEFEIEIQEYLDTETTVTTTSSKSETTTNKTNNNHYKQVYGDDVSNKNWVITTNKHQEPPKKNKSEESSKTNRTADTTLKTIDSTTKQFTTTSYTTTMPPVQQTDSTLPETTTYFFTTSDSAPTTTISTGNTIVTTSKTSRSTAVSKKARETTENNTVITELLSEIDIIKYSNIYDIVTFGDLEWYIVHIDDSGCTLLCKDILAKEMQFNENVENVSWATCSLRTWLNKDFYDTFTKTQKKYIVKTECVTEDNEEYGTHGGYDTLDYIYIMSVEEANVLKKDIREAKDAWWLRTAGYSDDRQAMMSDSGDVNLAGNFVDGTWGVRPALNLKF